MAEQIVIIVEGEFGDSTQSVSQLDNVALGIIDEGAGMAIRICDVGSVFVGVVSERRHTSGICLLNQ